MVFLIDPQVAGISGDMFLSALVSLGADKKKIFNGCKIIEKNLKGSELLELEFKEVNKTGISAQQLELKIKEELHERKGSELKICLNDCLKEISLSEEGKKFSRKCIDTLIKAESKVHGKPEETVHFHEASSIDTLIDIVGVAIALDDLNLFNEDIISMPVEIGGGMLTFSHGTTSNPGGAILEIFKNSGIIVKGGMAREELTTPTGASLLVNLVSRCEEYYPAMMIKSIGYGAGEKNFENFSNVLKVILGTDSLGYYKEKICVLETNVDDISGEILGELVNDLMREKAKDVTISSGITKKNRPTHIISIICDFSEKSKLINLLISKTHSLGVRVYSPSRYVVKRSQKEVDLTFENIPFKVRLKIFEGIPNKPFKIEFDDLQLVSKKIGRSIQETELIIRNLVKL